MPYKTNKDLPPAIKNNLPDSAQSIFRGAYNAAAEQGMSEERANAIAWSAVKRKFKKDDKGAWVAKTGDSLNDAVEFDMEETFTFDAAGGGYKMTKEGYLVAEPRVARTGIQKYKGWELGEPTLDEISIYRSEDEVFHTDAMSSLAFRPVTNDHPPDSINARNWKKYSVGMSSGDVVRDGDCVRVPMMILDSATIEEARAGKRQLSVGYSSGLIWGDGVTPAGEKYNAKQIQIRGNHIAVCQKARGGSRLSIGDHEPPQHKPRRKTMAKTLVVDNISVEFEDDRDGQIVERKIGSLEKALSDAVASVTKLTTDLTTLQGSVSTKDAEIATLKKQVTDNALTPEKIDAAARARSGMLDVARKMLGDALIVDGRSDADIQRQCVTKFMGGPNAITGWNDDQIAQSFRTIAGMPGLVQAAPGAPSFPHAPHNGVQDAASAFMRPGSGWGYGGYQPSAADKAYQDGIRDMEDAWKPAHLRPATAATK